MRSSQSFGLSVITERADGLVKLNVLCEPLNFMRFKLFHCFIEHPAMGLSVFSISLTDSSFTTS